eukprot:9725975-Lingulodinium_polyedra.AAC.1
MPFACGPGPRARRPHRPSPRPGLPGPPLLRWSSWLRSRGWPAPRRPPPATPSGPPRPAAIPPPATEGKRTPPEPRRLGQRSASTLARGVPVRRNGNNARRKTPPARAGSFLVRRAWGCGRRGRHQPWRAAA